jgi:protein SCO1/2
MTNRGTVRRAAGVLLSAVLLSLTAAARTAAAHQNAEQVPNPLRGVAFEQRLNGRVPADLTFQDESDKPVRLGHYFGRRPLILMLAYYDCSMLCPLVLNGLVRSLRALAFDIGDDFQVLTVSFDPRDTPARAAAMKATAIGQYGRSGAAAGWHFLTGEEAAIGDLTRAVGFRYAYDADTGQFAHPAGIVVLTPDGTIARYLFGIELSTRDLRLALVEAAAGTIGSPVDHALLYCYRYDPSTGKYGLVIMNVIRLAGLATVLALGAFIVAMCRLDRRRQPQREAAG